MECEGFSATKDAKKLHPDDGTGKGGGTATGTATDTGTSTESQVANLPSTPTSAPPSSLRPSSPVPPLGPPPPYSPERLSSLAENEDSSIDPPPLERENSMSLSVKMGNGIIKKGAS